MCKGHIYATRTKTSAKNMSELGMTAAKQILQEEVGEKKVKQTGEKREGGEEKPEEKPEEELTPEGRKAKLMRDKAEAGSREHYTKVHERMQKLIKDKPREIEDLLRDLKLEQKPGKNEIKRNLGLTDTSEGSVDEDVFNRVLEVLKECKPTGKLDLEFSVIKEELENKTNIEVAVGKEMDAWDKGEKGEEGGSWYHTDDRGQKEYKRIEQEASQEIGQG